MQALEDDVADIKDKLNYGTGIAGQVIIAAPDDTLVHSTYYIGTNTLSTTSTNTVATEAAVTDALSWKTIQI